MKDSSFARQSFGFAIVVCNYPPVVFAAVKPSNKNRNYTVLGEKVKNREKGRDLLYSEGTLTVLAVPNFHALSLKSRER